MTDTFNVAIFFPDNSYIYERKRIGAEEAVNVAKNCTERPAALIGVIRRVIIECCDDGSTCFEWQFGKGVTFPPKQPDGRFSPGEQP